ncbi:MAG TPA: hypothetical protein VGG10_16230 [Rhizomicrobium sp.]
MRKVFAVTITLGLAGVVMPAHAQRVGTYRGTTADGNQVYFTVARDADSGKLELSSGGIQFTSPCTGAAAGTSLSGNWGFGFTAGTEVITKEQVTIKQYLVSSFYMSALLHFTDDKTISGSVGLISAELVPVVNGPPKQAAYCSSARQLMSLKYTPSAQAPVPGGTVIGKRR